MRDVAIIGIGQIPVGEHWETSLRMLAADAIAGRFERRWPIGGGCPLCWQRLWSQLTAASYISVRLWPITLVSLASRLTRLKPPMHLGRQP